MTTTINQYHSPIAFHPGETLAEKLDELGMGPKEFAVRSGKPEKTIIAVLKGKSSITPEMAVRFEQVLHIPAHFWLNKQRAFDEFRAREERKATMAESFDWAKAFPVAEMVKKGWISACSNLTEKTSALLGFFGLSSHEAWEDYYFKQQLKVSFRISLAHVKEPHAISAWLRKGELQAAAIKAQPYSEKAFRDTLPRIKTIMESHPENFFDQLQNCCAAAGVKVVHTPCISKAPINGSTRWMQDHPVIQLSARYKRNDVFWFTFFHEAGHIILHGKKDVFLENIEYSDMDREKEREADEFAIRWTMTHEQFESVLRGPLYEPDIEEAARKIGTHPAIIVGRLQREKRVPYTFGTRFIIPINL